MCFLFVFFLAADGRVGRTAAKGKQARIQMSTGHTRGGENARKPNLEIRYPTEILYTGQVV